MYLFFRRDMENNLLIGLMTTNPESILRDTENLDVEILKETFIKSKFYFETHEEISKYNFEEYILKPMYSMVRLLISYPFGREEVESLFKIEGEFLSKDKNVRHLIRYFNYWMENLDIEFEFDLNLSSDIACYYE